MNVPHGMTEVTRDVFWKHVMSETRNIHPFSERNCTNWQFVESRRPWGWSSEGYATPHYIDEAEQFALVEVSA